MSPSPALPDAQLMQLCSARADALMRQMQRIAHGRMRDLPLLNPALQVQVIGWRPLRVAAMAGEAARTDAAHGHGWMAVGVLLTPWSMNLVQLPLDGVAAAWLPAPGAKAVLDCGGLQAEFIGAVEALAWPGAVTAGPAAAATRAAEAGTHWAQCSLFSPVLQFSDQAQAVAVAHEVLRLMRQDPRDAVQDEAPDARKRPLEVRHEVAVASAPQAAPSRRGFLLGRRPVAAAPGAAG